MYLENMQFFFSNLYTIQSPPNVSLRRTVRPLSDKFKIITWTVRKLFLCVFCLCISRVTCHVPPVSMSMCYVSTVNCLFVTCRLSLSFVCHLSLYLANHVSAVFIFNLPMILELTFLLSYGSVPLLLFVTCLNSICTPLNTSKVG